jgi:ribosomal protein S18 acetylase RimI-like enzyme
MGEFWTSARRRLRPNPVYRAVAFICFRSTGPRDGKQLYRTIETRIRRNLIENLVLWVFEQNTRARRFYEAMGFRLENEKQKEMRFAGANPVQVRYRKLLGEDTNETGK